MFERRTQLTNVLLALQMLKRRLRGSRTDARIVDVGLRAGWALADLLFGPDDQRRAAPSPSRRDADRDREDRRRG